MPNEVLVPVPSHITRLWRGIVSLYINPVARVAADVGTSKLYMKDQSAGCCIDQTSATRVVRTKY